MLDDMRLLVRSVCDADATTVDSLLANQRLAKRSRSRVRDTLKRSFAPRFIDGDPPQAWRIARAVEDLGLPVEIVRPVYYWITARGEPLLYDFVQCELFSQMVRGQQTLRTIEAVAWIRGRLAAEKKRWSEVVTVRVARGLLAALRDFGVLEGAVRKQIAPVHLPLGAFAYLAFALRQLGADGERLVGHRDWRLFLLSVPAVEHLFLEADRVGLLGYQAAGRIVRIDFPASTWEGMADVVAARAN